MRASLSILVLPLPTAVRGQACDLIQYLGQPIRSVFVGTSVPRRGVIKKLRIKLSDSELDHCWTPQSTLTCQKTPMLQNFEPIEGRGQIRLEMMQFLREK